MTAITFQKKSSTSGTVRFGVFRGLPSWPDWRTKDIFQISSEGLRDTSKYIEFSGIPRQFFFFYKKEHLVPNTSANSYKVYDGSKSCIKVIIDNAVKFKDLVA